MNYEKMYPTAWNIALNTSEFLVYQNLRNYLADIKQSNDIKALRFRRVLMSVNDSIPFQRFTNLLKQGTQYFCYPTDKLSFYGVGFYSRFIHRHPNVLYTSGRHDIQNVRWQWAYIGFIAKFIYTPWPEIISRKVQTRSRIPASEFASGNGVQHKTSAKELEARKHEAAGFPTFDLRNFSTITVN